MNDFFTFIIGFCSLVLSYFSSYFIIGEHLNIWFFIFMTVFYILFVVIGVFTYFIIERKLKC